jgi:hypothetical protein
MIRSKLFLFILLLVACKGNSNKDSSKSHDSAKKSMSQMEIPIDSLHKWADKNLKVKQLSFSGDTLKIMSADFYFYYPFGEYDKIDSISLKYPKLKLVIDQDTTQGELIKLYKMTSKDNFIKFVKNSDTKHIEIIYAKILDDTVPLLRGIKIGQKKEEFLKRFFIKPIRLKRVNNIKVISALEGINHNYHFDKDVLTSIVMDTDYLFYKF